MGIKPTDADIGRAVIYHDGPWADPETGVITSFNEALVFVRYGSDTGSKGTPAHRLEWAHASREAEPSGPADGWDPDQGCSCHIAPPCGWCERSPEDGWVDPETGLVWIYGEGFAEQAMESTDAE